MSAKYFEIKSAENKSENKSAKFEIKTILT